MDDAALKIVEWLLAQGWSGIIILALGAVVFYLMRELRTARRENADLQEKRIAEGRESLTTVAANTSALQNLTQVISLSSMARRS